MNPDIERIFVLLKPSSRKAHLFQIACNFHIWDVLNNEEREALNQAWKDVDFGKYVTIWGSFGTAWNTNRRNGVIDSYNPYYDPEREWQYKLLKHMFKGVP